MSNLQQPTKALTTTIHFKKLDMKKCKNCSEPFQFRFSTLEKYCWKEECKIVDVMQKIEQRQKLEQKTWNIKKKELKQNLMTTSDYLKITQQVFNRFIRLRDKDENCISCNKPCKKENAGHYYSQGGHSNVRFSEDNCHLQCEACNTFLSGNLLNYQIGIKIRIGEARLMELQAIAHLEKKWTKTELIEITKKYKEKCKMLM